MTKYSDFVRAYAKEHNLTYTCSACEVKDKGIYLALKKQEKAQAKAQAKAKKEPAPRQFSFEIDEPTIHPTSEWKPAPYRTQQDAFRFNHDRVSSRRAGIIQPRRPPYRSTGSPRTSTDSDVSTDSDTSQRSSREDVGTELMNEQNRLLGAYQYAVESRQQSEIDRLLILIEKNRLAYENISTQIDPLIEQPLLEEEPEQDPLAYQSIVEEETEEEPEETDEEIERDDRSIEAEMERDERDFTYMSEVSNLYDFMRPSIMGGSFVNLRSRGY